MRAPAPPLRARGLGVKRLDARTVNSFTVSRASSVICPQFAGCPVAYALEQWIRHL